MGDRVRFALIVDRDVSEDMATVFTWLAREEDAVYPTDYRGEIEAIIARWRPAPA